jgi:hypothetical protein
MSEATAAPCRLQLCEVLGSSATKLSEQKYVLLLIYLAYFHQKPQDAISQDCSIVCSHASTW